MKNIRLLARKELLGEAEESSAIVFDFGNFKFRGTLQAKPRKGMASGSAKTTKLYLFQIKVTSSIKLKRASETNFKKLLEDADVSFEYKGKPYHGVVREVKVSEIIESWHITMKIALADELEESAESEEEQQLIIKRSQGQPNQP